MGSHLKSLLVKCEGKVRNAFIPFSEVAPQPEMYKRGTLVDCNAGQSSGGKHRGRTVSETSRKSFFQLELPQLTTEVNFLLQFQQSDVIVPAGCAMEWMYNLLLYFCCDHWINTMV